jgi:hypothetical protein
MGDARRMKLRAPLLAVALLAAACGGNVVVDSNADTSTSTSTTTTPASTCVAVCTKNTLACPPGSGTDCAKSCALLDPVLSTNCPDLWDAWLACEDAHPGAGCDGSGACTAETNAFTPCLTQACTANPAICIAN